MENEKEIVNFWLRVNQLIKENKTTQENIAFNCSIPVQTFRGWINKKILPNVSQGFRIAKALNTSIDFLIDGVEVSTAPDSGEIEKLKDKIKRIETICKE